MGMTCSPPSAQFPGSHCEFLHFSEDFIIKILLPLDPSGSTAEFISTPSSVSSSTLSCPSSYPSSWTPTRSSRTITLTAFHPLGNVFPPKLTSFDENVDVQIGEVLRQLPVRLQQRAVQWRGGSGETLQDLQELVDQQAGRGVPADQLRTPGLLTLFQSLIIKLINMKQK